MITEEALARELIFAQTVKRFAYPRRVTLAEVFASVEVIEDYSSEPTYTWKHGLKEPAMLMSFCSVSHAEHNLAVTPSPQTVEWLTAHLLISSGFRFNFRAVVRDSGSVLITCDTDRIIASKWIALFSAADFPVELGVDVPEART